MSSQNNNRVLNRMGARKLTQDEVEQITGARTITVATGLPTGTLNNPDTMVDQ